MLSRIREERGAVAILTAVVLLALMAASAVAVDVGRLAVTSRDLQGATDRAALDVLLAMQRGGATTDTIVAADESFARNPGFWTARAETPTVNPMVCGPNPGQWGPTGSWGDATGVEVITTTSVDSLFLPGTETSTITRRAVACSQAIAAVSVASTLATVDDGLVNALLGALIGSSVELGLVGWQGLADAHVTLRALRDALGTELGLEVGTVEQFLATEITVGQFATVLAGALGSSDVSVSADLLSGLASLPVATDLPPIVIGQFLDITTASGAALDAAVDGLGLLVAAAQVANHNAGVAAEVVVPGITRTRLLVTEPPQIAVGPPGEVDGQPRTVARTAQIALDLELPIGVSEVEQIAGGVDPAIAADIENLVSPFRAEIDALGSGTCTAARAQTRDQPGTIRTRIEAAIDDVLTAAEGNPTLLQALGGVVTSLTGLLGSLTDSLLGCGLLGNSSSGRQANMNKLYDLLATYEDALVIAFGGDADAVTTTGSPALSVRVAGGEAALTGASCASAGEAVVDITGRASSVQLTSWTPELVEAPTAVPLELLDLDLGLIQAKVGLGLDLVVGGPPNNSHPGVSLPGAFPSDPPHRTGATALGLGSILAGIEPDIEGTNLLGLPLDGIVEGLLGTVTATLSPITTTLDGQATSLLGLLGVEVGVVETRALSVDCDHRVLVD